jgi:hypothetical protein
VLAGLYQRNATYLSEAINFCLSDSAPEVASLAIAITDPPIERFRSMLYSELFETAWAILRLLRIVPFKMLAKDVCAQIDRVVESATLTYDSLYALANPGMAAEAVPILLESRGLRSLVATIVAVLTNSDGNAARNFAFLLVAFEVGEVEAALAEMEGDRPDARTIIITLRRYIWQLRQADVVRELFVAGYASDTIDVERDYLDIREDVQTLTAVMLAREVKPPLAIGLFGDWGSGKSYFMQSMKAATKHIADTAKNTPNSKFCSEVVSVEFNAWHYADTNLWASLVTHILERLAAHVSPALTPEQQVTALVKELESAKSVVSQIEGEVRNTDEEIKKRHSELQTLQAKRQQKELELRDLRLADLQTVLSEEPTVKQALNESCSRWSSRALATFPTWGRRCHEVNSLRGRATPFLLACSMPRVRQSSLG